MSNQPAEWYHTCSQCPLDRFIKCLVDGDLNSLIITGSPTLGDLAEAWGNIYAEYLDLNNDNESIYLLQLQKEIQLYTTIKVEVETSLYFLSIALLPGMASSFRKELVEVIQDHGFDFPFDVSNPEQFQQSIEAVNNRLSPIRLRLELNTKEYLDYLKSKGDQTIDSKYFDRWLTRIARFRRIAVIRASQVTVTEFIMMIQDYLDFMKERQKTLELDGNER